MVAKISTLGELQAAYVSGTVTAPLTLDNDWAGVYEGDDAEKVFDSDPQTLLEDALKLLGIPWEHV